MSGLRCSTVYYRRTTSRACLFVFTSSLLGLRSVLHYARTARHSQLSHTLVLFSLPSFHYVNEWASYHRLTLMTGPCELAMLYVSVDVGQLAHPMPSSPIL